MSDKYHVLFLNGADLCRYWDGGTDLFSFQLAQKNLRFLKNRGHTAWIEDNAGTFVPVPGTTRKPKTVEELLKAEQERVLKPRVRRTKKS